MLARSARASRASARRPSGLPGSARARAPPRPASAQVERTQTNPNGFSNSELTRQTRDLKEIFDFCHQVGVSPDNPNQWPEGHVSARRCSVIATQCGWSTPWPPCGAISPCVTPPAAAWRARRVCVCVCVEGATPRGVYAI
jgi:hypothetical protein